MVNLSAIFKSESMSFWIKLITIIEREWLPMSVIIEIFHLPLKKTYLSCIKIYGIQA